jgi:hypothetical protein
MINITIGESKPQEKPFPKLMKSSRGGIFIFKTEKEATCIMVGNSGWDLGDHDAIELFEEFTDYNDPITLQNA